MIRTARYLVLTSAILLGTQSLTGAPREGRFDLVVYGSTASGVTTAVSAAREGLRVAIVDPGHHIGGMVAGGLSSTDRGNIETIGGISREFFERAGKHYDEPIEWDFEPHVAEQILTEMLREAHVAVFLDSGLREKNGVNKKGSRITAISTENGAVFYATEFVDASYEGDLMAEAGVSYTWGREDAAQYGESYAGVLKSQRPDHQFNVRVSSYTSDGSLLPGVSPGPKGAFGEGDKKIPAYNFRFCFTGDKSDQVPYPKPDGYDPKQYELLARLLAALTKAGGHAPRMRDLVMMEPLKGGKFDVNNRGAFSTDDIGANWDYPNASYKRRAEIIKEHYRYDAGFFYFLAHDPRVPPALQNEVNQFGLAKDEFTTTNNWPWQFYVRESRRMLGEYVVTQHDILENTTKPDSIGMGSYPMDSHNVQRVPTPDGAVENEGDMFVDTKQLHLPPYEIPYRSIVPNRSQAVNLLVPVCLSGSHVSYGTLRTEPVYMMIGHAAGVAAAIAAHKNIDVQDVPVPELQAQLTSEHAILHRPSQNSSK